MTLDFLYLSWYMWEMSETKVARKENFTKFLLERNFTYPLEFHHCSLILKIVHVFNVDSLLMYSQLFKGSQEPNAAGVGPFCF